jgi:hypothetical protein
VLAAKTAVKAKNANLETPLVLENSPSGLLKTVRNAHHLRPGTAAPNVRMVLQPAGGVHPRPPESRGHRDASRRVITSPVAAFVRRVVTTAPIRR